MTERTEDSTIFPGFANNPKQITLCNTAKDTETEGIGVGQETLSEVVDNLVKRAFFKEEPLRLVQYMLRTML